MNDRYLYRGRSVDNGAWVEGNRIDDGVTGQVFIHAVGNSVNESDKVGEEGCLQFVAFEVDPSTICQCTGLKDKNRKLIWENDIVSFTHSKITSESLAKALGFPNFEKEEYKRNYVIEFVNTYCTYGLRFRNKSIHFPCKSSTLYMHDCIVIGNLFDNPELLEVANG